MCGTTDRSPGLRRRRRSITPRATDKAKHPQKHLATFAGILQADRYNGFEPLFDPQKKVRPITPAFCFAHARRGLLRAG